MTAEYPREEQNPPTIPGARPEDQPAPRQRVPDHWEQKDAEEDPRGIDSGWQPEDTERSARDEKATEGDAA